MTFDSPETSVLAAPCRRSPPSRAHAVGRKAPGASPRAPRSATIKRRRRRSGQMMRKSRRTFRAEGTRTREPLRPQRRTSPAAARAPPAPAASQSPGAHGAQGVLPERTPRALQPPPHRPRSGLGTPTAALPCGRQELPPWEDAGRDPCALGEGARARSTAVLNRGVAPRKTNNGATLWPGQSAAACGGEDLSGPAPAAGPPAAPAVPRPSPKGPSPTRG